MNKKFKYIMKSIAGSHLYGTNDELSDTDIRGVFIPTEEYFFGFSDRIEQIEDKKNDITYYDVRKFFKLCLDCNPNIVELLFVPRDKILISSPEWEEIVQNRDLFLSKKARFTFSGYAVSQLHRIKQHRNWLLNPPKRQPLRTDFGLPIERTLVTKDQLNAFDELLNTYNYDVIKDFELDINTIDILRREKAFINANQQWNNYKSWENNRNPKRAKLEKKYGMDVKHGSHLYRLITEGEELLLTGKITLPRPDSNFILDIKRGKYSYDELIDMIGDIDKYFDVLYSKSTLPYKPDQKAANELCIKLVKSSLNDKISIE